MKILGIDYGRRKVGLAISEGKLAEPYMVIGVGSIREAVEKAVQTANLKQVDRIVVGNSGGEMGKESSRFGLLLKKRLNIPVESWDEDLTTHEAQKLSIEAGIRRKRRKDKEDAYAAAIMLQGYLDAV